MGIQPFQKITVGDAVQMQQNLLQSVPSIFTLLFIPFYLFYIIYLIVSMPTHLLCMLHSAISPTTVQLTPSVSMSTRSSSCMLSALSICQVPCDRVSMICSLHFTWNHTLRPCKQLLVIYYFCCLCRTQQESTFHKYVRL